MLRKIIVTNDKIVTVKSLIHLSKRHDCLIISSIAHFNLKCILSIEFFELNHSNKLVSLSYNKLSIEKKKTD